MQQTWFCYVIEKKRFRYQKQMSRPRHHRQQQQQQPHPQRQPQHWFIEVKRKKNLLSTRIGMEQKIEE